MQEDTFTDLLNEVEALLNFVVHIFKEKQYRETSRKISWYLQTRKSLLYSVIR